MLFAIGSRNPAKVRAATGAVKKYFRDAEFLIEDVDSGVDRQPINSETETGAMNRAVAAIKGNGAEFGIGIEGGLVELYGSHYVLHAALSWIKMVSCMSLIRLFSNCRQRCLSR